MNETTVTNVSNLTKEPNPTLPLQPTSMDILRTIQLVFYTVIFLMGGVGNILVLMIIKSKKSRRNNDYFILNLAMSDILVLFVSIPVDFYKKLFNTPSGYVICKFLWPFMTSALIASILTLTCMAIERSRVICKPMAPKLNGRQLTYVILAIWTAAIFCVIPLVIVAVPNAGSGECYEAWPYMEMRKIYTAALTAIQYVIPLAIIIVAYSMLSHRLRVSRQFRIDSIANSECSIEYRQSFVEKQRNESGKINKNLLAIVVLFAIFILPKQIAWLWLDFGNGASNELFVDMLVFAEVMLYIHSASNPIVYGTILRDYRVGFKKYLGKLFCCHLKTYNVNLTLKRVSPALRVQNAVPCKIPQ